MRIMNHIFIPIRNKTEINSSPLLESCEKSLFDLEAFLVSSIKHLQNGVMYLKNKSFHLHNSTNPWTKIIS